MVYTNRREQKMAEEKRDKTLSVKVSETAQKVFKELSEEAGLNQGDFIEELINEWRLRKLEEGAVEKIPVDLQSIFQSDVAKLKMATNAINTLFISQMENLSTEKIVWQSKSDELHEQIKQEKEQVKVAKEDVQLVQKEKAILEKDLDVQIKENETLHQRIQNLIESIEDKKGIIDSKEKDIAELNALIMKKENEIEKYASLKERNEVLEKENNEFKSQVYTLLASLEKEKETAAKNLKKKEVELDMQCKQAAIEREFKLKDEFRKQEDAIRKEVREAVTEEVKSFYVSEIKAMKAEYQNEIKASQKQLEEAKASYAAEIKAMKVQHEKETKALQKQLDTAKKQAKQE